MGSLGPAGQAFKLELSALQSFPIFWFSIPLVQVSTSMAKHCYSSIFFHILIRPEKWYFTSPFTLFAAEFKIPIAFLP